MGHNASSSGKVRGEGNTAARRGFLILGRRSQQGFAGGHVVIIL